MGRSPDKSLMVACGDEVLVARAHNVAAADDVVAAIDVAADDGVVIAIGDAAAIVV